MTFAGTQRVKTPAIVADIFSGRSTQSSSEAFWHRHILLSTATVMQMMDASPDLSTPALDKRSYHQLTVSVGIPVTSTSPLLSCVGIYPSAMSSKLLKLATRIWLNPPSSDICHETIASAVRTSTSRCPPPTASHTASHSDFRELRIRPLARATLRPRGSRRRDSTRRIDDDKGEYRADHPYLWLHGESSRMWVRLYGMRRGLRYTASDDGMPIIQGRCVFLPIQQ